MRNKESLYKTIHYLLINKHVLYLCGKAMTQLSSLLFSHSYKPKRTAEKLHFCTLILLADEGISSGQLLFSNNDEMWVCIRCQR